MDVAVADLAAPRIGGAVVFAALAPPLVATPAAVPDPVAVASLSAAGPAATSVTGPVAALVVATVPGIAGTGVFAPGVFTAGGRTVRQDRITLQLAAGGDPPGRRHRLGVLQSAVRAWAGPWLPRGGPRLC